jgi:molybdenum storage protein
MHGMPPYGYLALPPTKGRIPIHLTDAVTLLVANLIGARSYIFVKDENGLYTDDPKKNPKAEFISNTGAKSLMEKDLEDLIVERPCLEILQNSEVLNEIQIINGLEEGNITRTLNRERVGTTIFKE